MYICHKGAVSRGDGSGQAVTEYTLPRDCPEFYSGYRGYIAKGLDAYPHEKYQADLGEHPVGGFDDFRLADLCVPYHRTGESHARPFSPKMDATFAGYRSVSQFHDY